MGRISSLADKWISRASGLYGLWPLAPVGLVTVASAYLSTGVSWIAALGAWGWLMTGVVTFVLATVGFACAARTRLWFIEAKLRAKLNSDSSPFDSMARVYENKRLFLKDLAPLGRDVVQGKNFIGCEIIGPGDIAVVMRSSENMPFPKFVRNTYYNINCVEIAKDSKPLNAITFYDCDFDSCHFYSLNLLFYHRLYGTDWNWITPRTVVAEPPLPISLKIKGGDDDDKP